MRPAKSLAPCDDYAMPPLVSHKVDEPGTAALAAWIDALP